MAPDHACRPEEPVWPLVNGERLRGAETEHRLRMSLRMPGLLIVATTAVMRGGTEDLHAVRISDAVVGGPDERADPAERERRSALLQRVPRLLTI